MGKLKAGIKKAGNWHLVPRELPPNCFSCFKQPLKILINNTGNTTTRHGWTNFKEYQKRWKLWFWKRVSLSVFQSSFLFFVTIDVILGGHICFSQSCDLILTSSYFTNAEVHARIANHWLKKWTSQPCTAPLSLIWSVTAFFTLQFWEVKCVCEKELHSPWCYGSLKRLLFMQCCFYLLFYLFGTQN